MSGATEAVVTILTGVISVALLAVLVGQKSQSANVIQAFGSAFSNALGIAEAPVTGASYTPNLSYPGGSGLSLPSLG